MTSVRRMALDDLFRYNSVNLDPLTETYDLGFYGKYFMYWPDLLHCLESKDGVIVGYLVGKAEGKDEKWHGHISAVTISPKFRRLGLGRRLCELCQFVAEKIYDAYFVDLFVRADNVVAVSCYLVMGYVIYRRVLKYYSSGIRGPEDALEMRIAMERDAGKKSMVPLDRDILPRELEYN